MASAIPLPLPPVRAPQGVAVDSAGNVYIADTENLCVRELINTTITTFAGTGGGGGSSNGDSVRPTKGSLGLPYAIAMDSAAQRSSPTRTPQRRGFLREVVNG